MIRHLRHGLANLTAQLIHPLGKAERIRRVGPLIPDVGDDALADIDGDPARFEEQTLAVPRDPGLAAPQLDLLVEAVGHLHRPDMIPEARIVAVGGVVMKDQEVADPVIFEVDEPVERIAVGRIDPAIGE